MKLHICDEVALPLDVATQTIAILATRRVGKTYTASVLAEELIGGKIPFVVMDPTGAWWGLRSSADGKSEGYPVIIIGGDHGDIPLDEHGGKVIADLVVDHPGYYVIDFSKFEFDAQTRRFATDFGKRFYFRKEQSRFACQLIIDEADVFIPQRPGKDQLTMLGTYDNIVRRGGIRGIGTVLITQRPAVLNKNVLTQCETLIQLRMSGHQDVEAVKAWTDIHGTPEQRKEFMGTIAALQQGEAWLWSPHWLKVFQRVHIRQRKTFNSSATPKAGAVVAMPKRLAAVDIAKLGEQIQASITKSKENDPDELKKTIRGLQSDVIKLKKDLQSAEGRVATREVQVPVFDEKQQKILKAMGEHLSECNERIDDNQKALDQLIAWAIKIQPRVPLPPATPALVHTSRDPVRPTNHFLNEQHTTHLKKSEARAQRQSAQANGKLPKAETLIVNNLALYGACHRNKLAILCGYAVTGGGFKNALGALRSQGLITQGEPIQITNEGEKFAVTGGAMPTGEPLYNMWMQHNQLGHAEREILRVLWESKNPMPPIGIAANTISATGQPYEASGGGFKNALGKLRTLELITGRTEIGLVDVFLEAGWIPDEHKIVSST